MRAMEQYTLHSELPRMRWACYAVASVGGGLTAVATAILVVTFTLDHGMERVYTAGMALCAAIYFSGIALQAIRASRLTKEEHELPRVLRYLSQSVMALCVALGLLIVFVLWTATRPVY